jgi:radical SAM protein with 4Fe4S-binding SPASM domain
MMSVPNHYFGLATAFHDAGRWDAAETVCRTALSGAPSDMQCLILLGIVKVRQGDGGAAVAVLARALAVDPGSTGAWGAVGQAACACGRIGEAIRVYRRALMLAPGSADAGRNLGYALLQDGRPGEALAQFRVLIASCEPAARDPAAWLMLTAALTRMVAVEPASAEAWNALGQAYWVIGQSGEGIAAYTRALVVRPGLPDACCNLGGALRGLEGRTGEAMEAYRQALRGDALHAGANIGLASLLHAVNRLDEARVQARTSLAVTPGASDSWRLLGFIAIRMKRGEDAVTLCSRARQLAPGPVNDSALGYVLLENGRPGEALPVFRSLMQHPDPAFRHQAEVNLYITSRFFMERNDMAGAIDAMPVLADGTVGISPLRVRLESSSACNLRCRHCPTGVAYGSTDRRVMKAQTFESILANLKNFADLQSCVMYLGGEPLLNPRLGAMSRRIVDETRVRDVFFTTNAMLLTGETGRALAHSGITRMYVSIDGRTPQENDEIRRGASYEVVRRNLLAFLPHARSTGVAVSISNVVVRRPDDPEVPEIPEFLRRDFPGVTIRTLYAMKWPGWESGGGERTFDVRINEGRRQNFCGLPFTEMVVRANGDMTLCCYDISGLEVMGSIKEQSLSEVWNSPKYRALRRAMLDGDIDSLPEVCRRCPIYNGAELVEGLSDLS